MLQLWIRSLVIGLSIAAPVGPIGLLCIRRTLALGRRAGLMTGLGAAAADGVYGAVAAFGLSAVSAFLIDQQNALRIGGGLFLIYLGQGILRSKPASRAAEPERLKDSGKTIGDMGMLLSTFALTLTNPMTILSFIAIFSGLGLAGGVASHGIAAPLLTVAGVFTGSALWWLTLTFALSRLKILSKPENLIWINRFSGLVILGFGTMAIYQGVVG
ncbi:LysE/ArgO family amino acid transporter [Acidaminobacter hydrogenoformans]|uniref:Threonine/homoserine/homoserine lactone efflux protein n=1 Tax=Acidaminobacter hydrogenoformans DSM 2784 TaxID=1120920 RepID=A0A1G5RUM1_9FIRM|nr:LysE family translocator [Acidaminobacter hydrogenoformans]SCZ77607.1 Threonine/homoserine/homoserine lactone efflux protein [Acidaminobacter hydrogenoformans DSM 2784]